MVVAGPQRGQRPGFKHALRRLTSRTSNGGLKKMRPGKGKQQQRSQTKLEVEKKKRQL
jgi:hypothetical protein